jgi:hypothetical protein
MGIPPLHQGDRTGLPPEAFVPRSPEVEEALGWRELGFWIQSTPRCWLEFQEAVDVDKLFRD